MWTVAWELYHDFPTLRRMLLGANRFHEALPQLAWVLGLKGAHSGCSFQTPYLGGSPWLENELIKSIMVIWEWFEYDTCLQVDFFFRFLSFLISFSICFHNFSLQPPPETRSLGHHLGRNVQCLRLVAKDAKSGKVSGKHNTCCKIDDLPCIIIFRHGVYCLSLKGKHSVSQGREKLIAISMRADPCAGKF